MTVVANGHRVATTVINYSKIMKKSILRINKYLKHVEI